MADDIRICDNPECNEIVEGRSDKRFHNARCRWTVKNRTRTKTYDEPRRRDRVSCPNRCGWRPLRYNVSLHLQSCDGRGVECQYNSEHSFNTPNNRRRHEMACPDSDGRCCAGCGEWKPWVEYHRNQGSLAMSGRSSYCISCSSERGSKYKRANPQVVSRWTLSSKLKRRRTRSLEYQCARHGCVVSWCRIKSGNSPKYCQWHNPRVRFNSDSVRRRRLSERDGSACAACGVLTVVTTATEDHCFPKSIMAVYDRDDSLEWLVGLWNLELMCTSCNSSKNDRLWPEQAERAMARFETEHGYRPELLVNLAAAASVWQPS